MFVVEVGLAVSCDLNSVLCLSGAVTFRRYAGWHTKKTETRSIAHICKTPEETCVIFGKF